MAGLTLVCRLNKVWPVGRSPQASMWLPGHLGYESRVVFEEPWGKLSLSAYPGYPFSVYETPAFQIAIEGRIYDRSSATLQGELADLAEALLTGAPDSHRQLTRWVGEADGEFLVIARSKSTPNIAVFSDHLSRLPVYWTRVGGVLMLSRHLEVFVKHFPDVALDPMGVAQSLVFGYSIGARTLLRDVKVFNPGTLMLFRPGSSELELEELQSFNFEEKAGSDRGLSSTAEDIAILIRDATLRRVRGDGATVVSLSGGLDSRAVVAALAEAKVPVSAASHLDHKRRMLGDVEVAKDLAVALGIPWQLCELSPVTGSDALDLLHLKGGTNSLHMALLLPFLYELNRQYGSPVTLFTGDGGDKVMPDLRPATKLRDLRELVGYVGARNYIFSPAEVEKLTGVSACEIVSELEATLAQYPERDLGQKYVHFLLFERGRRWLYEGEDRNRAILWPTTPFYAPDVFRRCMTTSDDLKADFRLYRQVLGQLSSVAVRVENANWGVSVDSSWATVRLFLQSVYRGLPDTLRTFIKGYGRLKRGGRFVPRKNAGDCLRQMLSSFEGGGVRLSPSATESLMTKRGEAGFHILFTVAALIEWINGQDSSLESHLDEDLF